LNSLGVNAHIDAGSALWTNATVLRDELAYLGINNVRDGAPFSWSLPAYIALAKAGINFDLEEANIFITNGVVNAAADVARIDALVKAVPGSVISIEGSNEYNINS
jgi:hypothetical protein